MAPLAGCPLSPGVPKAFAEPGNPLAAPGFWPSCDRPALGWRRRHSGGGGDTVAICVLPAQDVLEAHGPPGVLPEGGREGGHVGSGQGDSLSPPVQLC